jgi:hypothetical protein
MSWSRISVLVLLAALATPYPLLAQVLEPAPAAEAASFEGPPVSPRGAFLRSLALPGWGQAYVGAPERGAVYFSLASGSVWMSYVARTQLNDARREQAWLRETGAVGPTEETEFALARARHFEDWVALTVFLFFLSGADAYVSAYLSDFQDRIGVRPMPDGAFRIDVALPVRLLR